ncbi:MAG: protein jag [Ruminococcus sp.]|uniref:RNA-binding cell elongation regulator Jag/EloR n=1 Tax=uncultured Ruminococcus sp. TaxID=165186 RepID=UPI00292D1344|nr:RNA-binding cell elongation regulator Jag/EloR [uncultured Ruminococcus sp.]MBQ1353906.1 protein jag [Ruminococcus sp.]MBQ2280064.1 protein jag [Ruminococcus sp.]MBQ2442500.1 protein jag [Ruminococcus sp.]MBQ4172253.1 protein jag [Ruminococcus sp.]MBR0337004.1 protein jag [Ruminococcus sp.]
MIKEAICEGSDVQDALKKAKAQLGLDETAEYEFEIIQTEEKKKFGLFGGRPAKVRVFIKDTPDERAEKFLRDVLDKMTLQSVEIEKSTDENAVEFNLSGEEVGFVIGRRGETLDALQYLTSLVANHGEDPYIKVTVNTGNYREKREKTLEILGRKLAFKAIKTGKKTSLEPMNPYERRIIHTAVQKVNGAISWSEGENAARHVVIGPDPKVKQNRRGGYQNNRRGGRRSYNGGKKSSTAPVNPDRVPLNEGGETGLYGRIK